MQIRLLFFFTYLFIFMVYGKPAREKQLGQGIEIAKSNAEWTTQLYWLN